MDAELNQMRKFKAFERVRALEVPQSDITNALDFTWVHKWEGDIIRFRLW